MTQETFVMVLPFVLAAVGLFLLLTPRNPWPRGIWGSELPLPMLRLMGAVFLVVAAIFFWLGRTGRLDLPS